MQVTAPATAGSSLNRKLGFFLLPPLLALVALTMLFTFLTAQYRSEYADRVYDGVTVAGVDLGGKTAAEAQLLLTTALPKYAGGEVTFRDPASPDSWVSSYADLGIQLDSAEMLAAAMSVGRSGGPIQRLQDTFATWYYGREIAPIVVIDESRLDAKVAELAAEIDQPAMEAAIAYEDNMAQFQPGQPGRLLDRADLRTRLAIPLSEFRNAEVELLVHDIPPTLYNNSGAAEEIQQILAGPVTFFLSNPLDELDLQPVILPQETLASWLRVEVQQADDGTLQHTVIVDENAVRHWLRPFADQLHREPVNARFYFDDDTRELVLVSPHINGRSLDIEATATQFISEIGSSNRSTPFIMQEIVPAVSSASSAAELGVTELITETTTWFYGSTDARKHNIARAAANFFGIVVAPGEEFSFNKYLGSVSEADGFEEGLIIVGGRTIKGIGGGVCQVSTTLYQSAFLAGYPITERWEHGYMLGYYNDGEGPGMDATVFSPIVDMKFINNTPHHILIENYYSQENEALTFKLYSTSMGREVEKTEPEFSNVRPAPTEDLWEFDPDLPEGTVVQIDSAVEGATVAVGRTVKNADGEVILDETVISNYIPYPNVYSYGPGVEPYDYSLLPEE